jgi:hypothetical protein
MMNMRRRFKVLVDLKKVLQVIADAYDIVYAFFSRFLNNNKLFNRVFGYQPNVRVSIEQMHTFSLGPDFRVKRFRLYLSSIIPQRRTKCQQDI